MFGQSFHMFGSWLALSFQKLDARWRGRQHFCSEQKGRISSFDFSDKRRRQTRPK
jgi:hypothetical protein